MNRFFSHFSDSVDQPESSSLSDSSVTTLRSSWSDEDVILASEQTKEASWEEGFQGDQAPCL
ncbi:C-repeat binding factor 1 [Prunus yedoensis var. nudiflora]|uniref:C-repeat binding factor 1 n=1 Tax=Prunus yedoensis var. nudiflora TaxID=2094558 RepID=A0A314ZT93_PRUYE|nr:C-repeat binding factor 1 [Prunus yedoensis var. nudiflora]